MAPWAVMILLLASRYSRSCRLFGVTLPPTHSPTENLVEPHGTSPRSSHPDGRQPRWPGDPLTLRNSHAVTIARALLYC